MKQEQHVGNASETNNLQEQINDNDIAASNIDSAFVTGYKGYYNKIFKRIIDFFLSIVLFIFILPIFIFVSIAIIIDDGMPIFYSAERCGFHGKTFKIYKFRSMINNADKMGGGTTALNDSRITVVGSIIRKLKLDEIPNIINVFSGDMSFIGPRPELLRYTKKYSGTEKLIFEVRPGITDYSSIEFINLDEIVGSRNVDEMYEKYVLPKKNKLRIKYAATVSIVTDIKLFGLTVFKVFEKGYKFFLK